MQIQFLATSDHYYFHGGPRFDKHQFENRRARAVSAETNISFSDYERMHLLRRVRTQSRRIETPSWVFNDSELRRVILAYCERRFSIRRKPGASDLQRLAAIRKRAGDEAKTLASRMERFLHEYRETRKRGDARRLEILQVEIQNLDSSIMVLRRLPEVATGVIHFYYRLGYDSVLTGEELHMRPPAVRQMLWKIVRAANPPGPRARPRAGRPARRWTMERLAALKAAHQAGRTWNEIADELEIPRGSIHYCAKRYLTLLGPAQRKMEARRKILV